MDTSQLWKAHSRWLEGILASPLRAVLAALVVAIVPVALVAAAAIDSTDQRVRAEKLAQADVAATRAAAQVDGIVRHLSDGLVSFAATPPVRESVASRSGPAVARTLEGVRPLLPQEVLRVFFVDRQGILLGIDPPAPDLIGQSFASRDYFVGVSKHWRPYVSETFVTAVQGTPSAVAIAVPVLDAAGQPLGALAVAIDLKLAGTQWFARLQATFDDVYVVDEKGLVITRAAAPGTDTRRDISADPAVSAALRGERVHRSVADFAGAGEMLVASAPVGATGWQLFITDSPAKLQGAVAPLRNVLGAVSLALILLTVAAALAVSFSARGLISQRQRLAALNSELQSAGQHKSEFLANMSHELRTPLNAILGFSQLLDEQLAAALTDRQRRYLRNIHDAGTHLLALINDVLDLSKVEAGRLEVRPERATTHGLVDPVFSAARAAADDRGVALDLATESATLDIDVGRVRQVLYNLLSNAVKFTPRGGCVSARVWTDGRDLHAEIRDSGIGIPADRQDRVFGVFERVNEDRSESSGTGLGLALTKQLVDLHGGTLTFESIEEKGTTFRVALPGVVSIAVTGERVLIVEDDPRDAELALAITAGLGLRAEHASTVDAAIEAARRSPPVAVLLDLQVAHGRGETVLRELRECATTHSIPIAILSVEDDDKRTRALGADEHFVKPAQREQVAAWLGRVAGRAAIAA